MSSYGIGIGETWKSKECLYNPKHKFYHNKHARSAALDTIATNLKQIVLNISPNDVKVSLYFYPRISYFWIVFSSDFYRN